MKEYLIALPIEEMPTDEVYGADKPLPAHCTAMHWFKTEMLPTPLVLLLCHAAAKVQKGIMLEADSSALFGPKEDIPVHVLRRNDDLNLLHTRLLMYLATHEMTPTELRWVGAGYRPHVRKNDSAHFKIGTQHIADRLVLVERKNDRTRVVRSSTWFPF